MRMVCFHEFSHRILMFLILATSYTDAQYIHFE